MFLSIQLCQKVSFLNGYQLPGLPRVGFDLFPERNLCYTSDCLGISHEVFSGTSVDLCAVLG